MIKLPTNYKDDILDTSKNIRRKFNMITNPDGTVSFEDVTDYVAIGSDFGATDINKTNASVNKMSDVLDSITGAKIIEDVTVSLGNESYIYNSDLITKDTLALIYWYDAYKEFVSESGVYANTVDGGIEFTIQKAVAKAVKCAIYLFGVADIEEEVE